MTNPLNLILMLFLGIVIGITSTLASVIYPKEANRPYVQLVPMPHCTEDEVILFNIPERDQLWCLHIDDLAIFYHPED